MSCLPQYRSPSLEMLLSKRKGYDTDSDTDSEIEIILKPSKRPKNFISDQPDSSDAIKMAAAVESLVLLRQSTTPVEHLRRKENIAPMKQSQGLEDSPEKENKGTSRKVKTRSSTKMKEFFSRVSELKGRKRTSKRCQSRKCRKSRKNVREKFPFRAPNPIEVKVSKGVLRPIFTKDNQDSPSKPLDEPGRQLCKYCRFTKETMYVTGAAERSPKPVEDIPGVGPVSAAHLKENGVISAKCLYGQYLIKGQEFFSYLESIGVKSGSAKKICLSMLAWDENRN